MLLTVADYEAQAARALDRRVANFVNAGWADGRAMRRNAAAFDDILFAPRRFADLARVSTTTEVLGRIVETPILLAPTGLQGLAHPDGEVASAAAARRAGSIVTAGIVASKSLEEIAAAAGAAPTWFQIYFASRTQSEAMVRRAEAAGCAAICLTVDIPVRGRMRLVQRRDGFSPTAQVQPANFARGETWSVAPVRIEDVEWLCRITELPVVIKGIMRADDAVRAVDAGAAAVIVSNHGGRESDSTAATIEVLPAVVDSIGDRAEVYLDGGVRRGDDVVKALALGARAVLIGRPFWWGLAVGGEDGVHSILEILREELVESLISVGCNDVRALDRSILHT